MKRVIFLLVFFSATTVLGIEIDVPAGFKVEIAAKPPLVKHPMMAGFDDRGRLFIAESAGKNLRRTKLEKQLPNFIRLLEDTNKDGVFDKSTIFADKMTLPMGALWYQGALYVAAPPYIWRLEDTDNDGVADKRQILVDKFGYSGNAASVHGCFLGPAGRLYWCDGRHGHEFKDKNGKIVAKGKAARIFSCKLDGSDVQVHCGGGMDNPVEIDFTERGEMLGTVNIFYRQRGDCLVHWMYGGVYPRHDQPCINEFPRTGDLMLPVHNYGHIGISGMMRYRSTYLGKSFQNNVFITEFNTHKVTRTRLTRHGSTFKAQVEDFLVAKSNDFHPTDVLEDADGSLLVIDTGGWFRIGCPTSRIAKPNILGAIYRIRRIGARAEADPRGRQILWSDQAQKIAQRLGDRRFAVRARAISELASRGDAAIPALKPLLSSAHNTTKTNAVWTLARINTRQSRSLIRQQLTAGKGAIAAAAYAVRMTKDKLARPYLEQLVADASRDPVTRREVATTLSVVGNSKSIKPLLNALKSTNPDRVGAHAIIHALHSIGDNDELRKGLADDHPAVAAGALIALRQLPNANLSPQEVARLLGTEDVRLKQTALDTISADPKWTDHVIRIVQDLNTKNQISSSVHLSTVRILSGMIHQNKVQAFVAGMLRAPGTKPQLRELVLDAMAESRLTPLPKSWHGPLESQLKSKRSPVVTKAVAAIAASGSRLFDKRLRRLVSNPSLPTATRTAALAIAAATEPLSPFEFQFLRKQVEQGSALSRLAAAQVLAGSALSTKQLNVVARLVKGAGPLELRTLTEAAAQSRDKNVGHQLITSLQNSTIAQATLQSGEVNRLFRGFPKSVQRLANQKLRSQAGQSFAKQAKRIDSLLRVIAGGQGNAANGKRVFLSKKTSCTACHRIDRTGQTIGPDLSLIGKRRNTRDLLEAIAFPSSSFARGFETHNLLLENGKIVSGMILSRSGGALVVRTTDQKEIRVRESEVARMTPNKTSIMPVGLERSMTDKELRDLIAYLRSLK